MKNTFLSGFLLLWTISISAQSNVQVTKSAFAGKNFTTSREITGTMYVFTNEYPVFLIDTVNRYLFVKSTKREKKRNLTTDEGHLHLIDLESSEKQWEKKMDFDSKLIQYSPKGVLVHYNGNTSLLDLKTGETLWFKKLDVIGFDNNYRILLAVNRPLNYHKGYKLRGIDIPTGKMLWETKERFKYGLDGMLSPTDSTLLVLSHGLHGIHVGKGLQWSYDARTSVKDYSGAIFMGVMGVASAFFTGFGFIPGVTEQSGMRSNVPIEDSNLYFANSKTIARLDLAGKKIWESSLPADGSRSHLRLKGDTLFMINLGYTESGYDCTCEEQPYVACFHKASGRLLHYQPLKNVGKTSKRLCIRELTETDDGFDLVYPGGATSFNWNTLTASSGNWDMKTNKKLESMFRLAYVYDPVNRTVRKIDTKVNGNRIALTNKDVLFEVNERLEIIGRPEHEQVLYRKGKWKNFTFVSHGDSPLYVLDENDKVMAELPVCNSIPEIFGNKLYMVGKKKCILEINLNQLLDENQSAIN